MVWGRGSKCEYKSFVRELCGNAVLLDLDCGGGIMNLYMIKWQRTINSHCPSASFILYYTYASEKRVTYIGLITGEVNADHLVQGASTRFLHFFHL